MPKKIDEAAEYYARKAEDTTETLIHLIDFLKEKFQIFEKFQPVRYVSLLSRGIFLKIMNMPFAVLYRIALIYQFVSYQTLMSLDY